MKSLLQLLREEDEAAKELAHRRHGLETIRKSGASEAMIVEFEDVVDDGIRRLEKAKDELQEYFTQMLSWNQWWDIEKPKPDKIEPFMQMLMREARRDSLAERCEEWGIDELSMSECVDYLENILGVSL